MQKRLSAVALIVMVLLLTTVTMAAAQTTTLLPNVPVPAPGSNVVAGQWDPNQAGCTITVSVNGVVLGVGVVQPDGRFVVYLSRSLQTDDMVEISSPCLTDPTGQVLVVHIVGPIPIPEPGTLLMLGAGLAGLAGYAGLRWRARK